MLGNIEVGKLSLPFESDTSGLERGFRRAQKASEGLEQAFKSTQQATAGLEAGLQSAGGGSEILMSRMPDVREQTEGVGKAAKEASDSTEELGKAAEQSSKGIEKLGSALQVALGVLAARAAEFAVKQIVNLGRATANFVKESILTAGSVSELRAVLGLLGERAGWTEAQIDRSVASMMELGIQSDVAMEVLSQFARQNLDVADALMAARVAQDLAVLSQRNSSETLSELIYAVRTQNSALQVMRDLGIQAGDALDRYAESIGRATEDLSQMERQQAMLVAIEEEGAKITGTYETAMDEATKAMRSLERHFFELRRAAGDAFLPAFLDVVNIVTEVTESLREMLQAGQPAQVALEELGKAVAAVTREIMGLTEKDVDLSGMMENMASGAKDLRMAVEDAAPAIRGLIAVGERLPRAFAMATHVTFPQMSTLLRTMPQDLAALAEAQDHTRDRQRMLDAVQKMNIDTTQDQERELQRLIRGFQDGRLNADDFAAAIKELLGIDLYAYLDENARMLRTLERHVYANTRGMYGLAGGMDAVGNAAVANTVKVMGFVESLKETMDAAREAYPTDAEQRYQEAVRRGRPVREQLRHVTAELGQLAREGKKESEEWYQLMIEQETLSQQLLGEGEKAREDSLERSSQQVSKHKDAMKQDFSELRSSLESAFRPTDVTELDMARTRLGVYEDKVDEFVRRIKAEAEGSRGAWEQLIPQDILDQGGDALTVWTAEAEDMFYGLRWDELEAMTGGAFDPQVAEERWLQAAENEIRAMRQYEARIEEMIPKLAARLGGLSQQEQAAIMPGTDVSVGAMPQALMAEDRAMQDARVIGESMAGGIDTALETPTYAQTITDQLRTGIAGREGEIQSIGEQMGGMLIKGAQDAMTGEVVDDFAKTLAPSLVRRFRQMGVLPE